MKTMKKFLCILIATMMVITFAACGKSVENTTSGEQKGTADAGGSSAQETEPVKSEADPNEEYVFVTAAANLEYWNQHKNALQAACKELGVKGTFVGDDKVEPQVMVTLLETVIAKKPAGIITPGHFPDAYKPVFEKAWELGIPVAVVTVDVPDSKRIVFIGTDYYQYGKTMAELAAEATGGDGKVIISTFKEAGTKSEYDISQGIYDTFNSKYPNMKIVAEVEDKADASIAAQVNSSALQAHPDASVIIGCQSVSAIGAVTALREVGKLGQVKVIGMDRDQPTLENIKEGNIYAAVAGKQYSEVYYALKFLYDYNHDRLPLVEDNKKSGVVAQPQYCDPGAIIINKDNVDDFINYDINKIRY